MTDDLTWKETDEILSKLEKDYPILMELCRQKNDFWQLKYSEAIKRASEFNVTKEQISVLKGFYENHQKLVSTPAFKIFTLVYVYDVPVSLEPPYKPTDSDPKTSSMLFDVHLCMGNKEVLKNITENKYSFEEIKGMFIKVRTEKKI